MTKEEVIEILERFVIGAKPCSQREIVDACASAYRMLKEQPSLPSNMDEAAMVAANSVFPIPCEDDFDDPCVSINSITKQNHKGFIKGFKAGAEWMAGQGARALASVGYYNQCGLSILTEPSIKKLGFKEGDELEITLRKK